MIGIKDIQIYHTDNKQNVLEIDEVKNLNEQELDYLSKCGIKYIYDGGELTSYDLAKKAAKKLKSNFKEKIDYIIYIKSRVPDYFIASEATRLKSDLNSNAKVISISDMGCADSSIAIDLALDLLKSNTAINNVLIAYGSVKYLKNRFRYPVTVTSDLGVACIVGRNAKNSILESITETNGKYWDLFKVDYQGKAPKDYTEECKSIKQYGFELAMESQNRFTNINSKLLNAHNLTYKDLDHVIMQNISLNAFHYYEELFNIKFSTACYENLKNHGHTGAADILLNFYYLMNTNQLKENDTILIMNNSPVACWNSMLIKV